MDSLVEVLGVDGREATQCFFVPNQSYRAAKGSLSRFWLRMCMYVLYPVKLAIRVLTDRSPCILVVTTNTFYAPLVALALRNRRNHRIVQLVYDLFPDAMVHSGLLCHGSFAWRTLAWIKARTLINCDANVALGEHLRNHLLQSEPRTKRAVVIEVGAEDLGEADLQADKSGVTEILYCGNLGRMHDTHTLVEALQCFSSPAGRLRFKFHASGPKYSHLQADLASFAKAGFIDFNGSLGEEAWRQVMRDSHVALVTMANGSEDVVMPSKTYSALSAGQAILAICPERSDLAALVREHNCGWVIATGDVARLCEVLGSIAAGTAELAAKRAAARLAYETHFSPAVIAAKWMKLFRELQEPRTARVSRLAPPSPTQ